MTHHMVGMTHEIQAIAEELRDNIADFDDFWRPIRNYFYWEPHCFDIPICWSLRAIFDSIDGVDRLAINCRISSKTWTTRCDLAADARSSHR